MPTNLLDFLPDALRERLLEHCRAAGEDPLGVVVDAIEAFFDDIEDDVGVAGEIAAESGAQLAADVERCARDLAAMAGAEP